MDRRLVVMGVSGCGKTTIGRALAQALEARFIDGDDLHPAVNVAKMRKGEPLNDDDRHPWLETVGKTLRYETPPTIIACSALKRRYRDAINTSAGVPVRYIYLRGHADLILERMAARHDHFMPTSLLSSQIAALEPLGPDEDGIVVDIDRSVSEIVAELTERLGKVLT